MPKSAALITIHGMGETPGDYAKSFFAEVTERLDAKSAFLYHDAVYYQKLLQDNEREVWRRVGSRLKWDELRKFVLFGFGDAAGLESGKEQKGSAYTMAQVEIARTLFAARKEIDPAAQVVVIAQSLGGQVLSNYLWDAAVYRCAAGNTAKLPDAGFWRDPIAYQAAVTDGGALTTEAIAFLGGNRITRLITTGCNIPVFVAAHARYQILPFEKLNEKFEWHNYYDKDDVLGWPLADLSDQYRAAVTDHQINAGDGFLGWIIKSWNPMSHGQYWGDDDVLDPLVDYLGRLLR